MRLTAEDHRFLTSFSQRPKYIPLSITEEAELLKKAQQGDNESRNYLILNNQRFVRTIAFYYYVSSIDIILTLEGLFQEGILGLIESIDKFEIGRKVRLITYAGWWIRAHIQKAINHQGKFIVIPEGKINAIIKLRELFADFIRDNSNAGVNDFRSFIELMKCNGTYPDNFPVDSREFLSAANSFLSTSFRIDALCDDSDSGDEDKERNSHILLSFLADDPETREDLDSQLIEEIVNLLLEELTNIERRVIEVRFILNDNEKPPSLRKTGRIVGRSCYGVQLIEKRAIKKMSKRIRQTPSLSRAFAL